MPKVDTQRAFSSPRLVKLFNEWMRRFTEEPEKFKAEFRTVGQFLKEQDAGREPSYGEHCAAYLAELEDDMDAIAAASNDAAVLNVPAPPKPTTVRKGGLPHRRKR